MAVSFLCFAQSREGFTTQARKVVAQWQPLAAAWAG
jgi:hypothetical protein